MQIVLGGRDEVSWLTGADVLLRWARGGPPFPAGRGPSSVVSYPSMFLPIPSAAGQAPCPPSHFLCLLIPTTSLTIPSWVPTNKQKLPSSISSKA